MKTFNFSIGLACAILFLGNLHLFAQEKIVDYKVKAEYEPFQYESMTLNGLLGERYNFNVYNGLMQIPYYSYLRAYKSGVASLWPSGEYLGKYVQGLVHSYHYYQDMNIMEQLQIIVDNWVQAQDSDGYLATSPDGYGVGPRWNFWAIWDH